MPNVTPPVDQLLPRFITIGFVGKRLLPPNGEAVLRTTLAHELDRLAAEFTGPNHVLLGLSALAMGADTVFTDLIIQRADAPPIEGQPSYSQQVFLPFQPDEFFTRSDFQRDDTEPDSVVDERRNHARSFLRSKNVLEVRITGFDNDRNERFADTAYEIVSECDLLLVACTQADKAAALDTPPASGFARGGSAETLHHAHTIGKRVIIIEVDGPLGTDGMLPVTLISAHKSQLPDHGDASESLAYGMNHSPVKEPQQIGFGASTILFTPTAAAVPLRELHYPDVLARIHARADEQAVGTKGQFVWDNEQVLGGHLAATFIAALSLALLFCGTLASITAVVKFGLLAVVLYMAWKNHHRQKQTDWVEARLLAELTRAAQALIPRPDALPLGQPPLYPGGPHHLRDFHLPELAAFAKSLYMLHLREFCVRTNKNHYDYGAHTSATAQEMAQHYVTQRLDATQNEGGQLAYFREARRRANARLKRINWWFFACSIAATVCAFGAIFVHPDHLTGFYELSARLIFKFLPLALPVAAAGLIAWIGLRDLDRETERYADMVKYLEDAREELKHSSTTAQLRRRIERLEMTLLQELVEWRAKIKATHPG